MSMQTFTAIEQGRAFPDAVTMGADPVVVSAHLLLRDAKEWRAKNCAGEGAAAARAKSIASFFLDKSKVTLKYGLITATAESGGIASPECASLKKIVCHRYAISRLVSILQPHDREYTDDSQPFDATSENKQILDYTEEEDHPPSVIVNRIRLGAEPFEGEATELHTGTQWYVNEQHGLYVAATSPAVISRLGADVLTITTGSPASADAIFDAEEAVNLRPYVSLRFLEANAGA